MPRLITMKHLESTESEDEWQNTEDLSSSKEESSEDEEPKISSRTRAKTSNTGTPRQSVCVGKQSAQGPFTARNKKDQPPSIKPEATSLTNANLNTLHQFGIKALRPEQEKAIQAHLIQEHLLLTLATGAGKTLCWAIPAYQNHQRSGDVTLVLGPSISLLNHFDLKLSEWNVPHIHITGEMSSEKFQKEFKAAGPAVLLMTPEKAFPKGILRDFISSLCSTRKIGRIVVEEAHAVFQTGEGFRPNFKNQAQFRTLFPNIPVTLITASLTPSECSSLLDDFNLPRSTTNHIKSKTLDRPNLHYSFIEKSSKSQLLKVISVLVAQHGEGPVLIYCSTTRDCELLAAKLDAFTTLLKRGVKYYHSKLSAEAKTETWQKWIAGEHEILVATNCLGLGVDNPELSLVIFASIPNSITDFYQMSGRAGRKGQESKVVVFLRDEDAVLSQKLLANSTKSKNPSEEAAEGLRALQEIAHSHSSASQSCRRRLLLQHFGEDVVFEKCANCDVCEIESEEGENARVFDVTEIALAVIRTVGEGSGGIANDGTLSTADVTSGKELLPHFGIASCYDEMDVRRLIWLLVDTKYIKPHLTRNEVMHSAPSYRFELTSGTALDLARGMGTELFEFRMCLQREPRDGRREKRPKRERKLLEENEYFEKIDELKCQLAEKLEDLADGRFGDVALKTISLRLPQHDKLHFEIDATLDRKARNEFYEWYFHESAAFKLVMTCRLNVERLKKAKSERLVKRVREEE
ncbi:P-loop containing nucleoside triphosphate hydrolase protein [Meredithblackwellia eburnea MCA 4105]